MDSAEKAQLSFQFYLPSKIPELPEYTYSFRQTAALIRCIKLYPLSSLFADWIYFGFGYCDYKDNTIIRVGTIYCLFPAVPYILYVPSRTLHIHIFSVCAAIISSIMVLKILFYVLTFGIRPHGWIAGLLNGAHHFFRPDITNDKLILYVIRN